ncbi:GPN1, partial [Cordylochernes scorpioides]
MMITLCPEMTEASDSKKVPTCLLVLGKAGVGKTTFVRKMVEVLSSQSRSPYVINLDPACLQVPYPVNIGECLLDNLISRRVYRSIGHLSCQNKRQNLTPSPQTSCLRSVTKPQVLTCVYGCADIRNTVNYKEVKSQYNLGPNGATATSLNLFATVFDQLMWFVGERAKDNEFIIIDTPGQMEVFNWSASGSIITKALCAVSVQASTYPTIVVFLLDLKQCQHPNSLLTNLLSCCSIMFQHKLPILAVMNKLDQSEPTNVLNWMNDFSEFRLALASTSSLMGIINSDLCMELDDFYCGHNTVALSSETGQGMEALFPAIDRAVEEYY